MATRLIRVKTNQVRMMADRGFKIPEAEKKYLDTKTRDVDVEIKTIADEDFLTYYEAKAKTLTKKLKDESSKKTKTKKVVDFQEALSESYTHAITGQVTRVMYIIPQKRQKKITEAATAPIIATFTKMKAKGKWQHVILVSELLFQPVAETKLSEVSTSKNRIIPMLYNFFLTNQSQNSLYCRHEALDIKEAKDFFLEDNITEQQTPPMFWNDAVRIWFDFPVGTVLRIYRYYPQLSTVNKMEIYYRLVSSAKHDFNIQKAKSKPKPKLGVR